MWNIHGFIHLLRSFLMAEFPYAYEVLMAVQAFQGALEVRLYQEGRHHSQPPGHKMHWLHALFLTIVCGNGGAIPTPTGHGQSMHILSDDMALLLCIGFFVLLRYTTFVMQFLRFHQFVTILFTFFLMMMSQLFRTIHTIHYTSIGYQYFSKQNALSLYSTTLLSSSMQRRIVYPIPIFGPILYGTLFGCMSGFLQRPFHGRLEREGLPRTVRNGLICATFYHFLVHDTSGPIGLGLNWCFASIRQHFNLPIEKFAILIISIFMQLDGILVWACSLRFSCEVCILSSRVCNKHSICKASKHFVHQSVKDSHQIVKDSHKQVENTSPSTKKKQRKKRLQSLPTDSGTNEKHLQNSFSKQYRKHPCNLKAD